jgi:hypothetical protein
MNKKILVSIVLINLALNIYGNGWGLPARWHSDEVVSNVLHMAAQKSLVDHIGGFQHPTGYLLFLLLMFAPLFLFLKIMHYPLLGLAEAASVSWANMARLFPQFACGVYLYARGISAVLGALTVYLIYRLAKEIYGEKAGLLSAASLSVCMGFVGTNHFAKYKALVDFLIVWVILLCVFSLKAAGEKGRKTKLLWAFFLAGIASSVHLNAAVLLLPLGLAFILCDPVSLLKRIPELCRYVLLFLAGILLATPSLLTHYREYLVGFRSLYFAQVLPQSPTVATLPVFIGPLNYFFEIMSIYGIPLFILIVAGLVMRLIRWKGMQKPEVVVLSWVLGYLFITTVAMEDKYPQTKHVIAAIPFLAIYAGACLAAISGYRRISRAAKGLLLAAVFLYSFAYCLKADLWFQYGDPRYASTRWVKENIPRGAKIEVFDQLTYVVSESIVYDYEIIYLGRSSKGFKGKNFFKWNTVEGAQEYLRRINLKDTDADYIIVDEPTNGVEYFLYTRSAGFFKDRDEYLKALFSGKKRFRQVKVIRPPNPLIESKRINGFFHFKNLWWDPIPSYRATAPTIYIFKRVSASDA